MLVKEPSGILNHLLGYPLTTCRGIVTVRARWDRLTEEICLGCRHSQAQFRLSSSMVRREAPGKQSARRGDYLTAIAMLGQQEGVVRVTQISKALRVKKPSVVSTLKKLSEEDLVEHERYGHVELTAKGEEVATRTIRWHKALGRLLVHRLGIDGKTAEEDASKIGHVISPLSMGRMTEFIEFIEARFLGEANFPTRYRYFMEHGELPEECLETGSGKGRRESQ